MANPAQVLRPLSHRVSYLSLGLRYAAPALAAAVIGALIATPSGLPVLLAVAYALWVVIWTIHWRASFIALFIFLPVAAVPGILLQQQGWPTFLKDALFLVPGYLGLTLAAMRNRTFRSLLPISLTLLLAGLIMIVLVQAVRLVASLPLVALIGLRSWLLYIPLIVVPTFIFFSIKDIQRFTHLLVVVSLVPSVVAIVEFALIAMGHSEWAYQWYGALGSNVSQGFGQVGISDQLAVHRVPSTFTFVTQFVAYCLITAPIALIVWLCDPDVRWRRVAALAAVLVVTAGLTSGSRTFYLWGPVEIFLVLLLTNRGRRQLALVTVMTVLAAALTIGPQLAQVASFIAGLGWDYLVKTQAAEFPAVYQAVGLFGAGAGIDTGGSRYVLASQTLPFGIEGWYALTFLELGLPGLILVLTLWMFVLRHSWKALQSTRQSDSGPLAVAIFVILASTVLNLYKGVSLEYDPLNVYFWFVTGLALAVLRVDEQRATVLKIPKLQG